MKYLSRRMDSHLSQRFLACVILLLWQILHIGAQDNQQSPPACFGEPGHEGVSLFNYNIDETDPTGTMIGSIPLKGISHGPNATISLTLTDQSGGDYLSIDPENKTLVLAQRVDRDGPDGLSQLTAKLKCNQIGGFELEYEIQVDVANINDNTPIFIGLPYIVGISELTRIGTTVFKGFEATDDDGIDRNGQVVYSIEPYAEDPDSNKWFTIRDAGRREITLERQLDYERKQQWLVLLQARDNGNPEFNYNYTVITINVLDGNDLPPIYVPCNITNITVEDCTNLTYSATILERTPLPDPLDFFPGPIYAVDADENVTNAEPIFYTLYKGTPSNYADYLSINSSSGDVRLVKPVCYNDIQRFDIEIKASEGPLPSLHNSSAFLAIGVLELNENPPEFNQTDYIGYVYENSPSGTQINLTPQVQEPLRIAAIDKDIDPACGTSLMYSLHDSSGSFILPEEEVGYAYVVTNRELDRENQAAYTLNVVAVEVNTVDQKESQPATVTVMVLDRNDNAPQFVPNQYSTESNRYKIEIRENHPVEAPIMVLHTDDPDSPTSDYVQFSFEYVTNPSGVPPFSMKRSSNTSVGIVLVPGADLVRGESHVVSLQVTDARDESLKSAVAYVEIEILKSNDTHAPRFTEDIFTATASEGLPVGTFVTTVTANDPDEEDSVTYSITAGNEDGTFEIEPTSGDIKIIKELDRETMPSYTINVTAFDGNLSSSAYLIVTVLDINDNNPQFNMSWPNAFIVLEGKADEFVGQVMAYDIDEEGTTNSEIKYGLTSDHFKINAENGSIYTKVALDREEQDRYEVSVVAMDNAAAARSSNLMVSVIVQDVNDNGPVFEPTEYAVELEEEAVLTDFLTLTALDLDESATLEYAITAGDTNIFKIDRTSGKMSLLQPLDYELAQTHIVTVTVTDVEITNGANNSTATVTVTVLDINDHRPVFTQPEYEGAILRTADLATVVVNDIVATDGDMPTSLNGQVKYRINPPNEWFTIPEANEGVIVTRRSLQQAPDFFNLTVIGYDLGTPTNGAQAYVLIDVRVEKPIFPEPILRVNSLMEGQPAGSHVVDVAAVANRGDQITYSIITDEQNLFRIESVDNMGKIYTTEVLDRETISTYIIDVQANLSNDSANAVAASQRRRKRATDTDVVEVIIELGDLNDNAPSFLQDKYYIGVSQDAGVSTTIITMEALDSDSGNNSAIVYSLQSTSSDNTPLIYFTIGSDSGIIATLQKLILSQKATKYEVEVIAKEKFSSAHDPASTIVSIALINNLYRAVLVGMVPPDVLEANLDSVKQTLEELLDALVFVEDVNQRRYGENLDQIDPSGSDTTFYAINTTSGLPLETEKIINNLGDNQKELNALYSSIISNGSWVETRHVGVGRATVINDADPTIEAIALICLGIVLFVACVLAIVVIIISWKKREMERQKQARIYLPMYTGLNPYANNEELEIANPVYFDDQSVQVNDELFPNGAPPNFLQEVEIQEATMDFAPEDEDEEANAVANSIAAACVVGSEKSSLKDSKGEGYPPSSGPPSYTSQENAPLPNLVYEADSLPRKVPPQPDRPPPPPPPSGPPPPPPSKPPAYDNPGVDLTDETDNRTNSTVTAQNLPTTQPRTDSLPHEDKTPTKEGRGNSRLSQRIKNLPYLLKPHSAKQAYSPSKEGSFQSGRSSVEPKELTEKNAVHLTKIYKPPSTFDTPNKNSTHREQSPNGIGNHIGGTDTGLSNGDTSQQLPNGKAAWEPDEVLTTAL